MSSKEGKFILANKIKKARLDANLTQKDIAKYLDIDQSLISKIEKGERRLEEGKLFDYANLLCIPLEFFLDDSINKYDRRISFRAEDLAQDDLDLIADINKIVLHQIIMDKIWGGRE